MQPQTYPPTLDQRRAGLLLHPTSLPGRNGNGDLGQEAYNFVDFLDKSGFSVWQTLPLGPVAYNASPYQSYSVHAGNPYLISLEKLVEAGWLPADAINSKPGESPGICRVRCLKQAWIGFEHHASPEKFDALAVFCREHAAWLDDYALFQALKESHDNTPWWQWPEGLRNHQPAALEEAERWLGDKIRFYQFQQFLFFRQWHDLRRYANQKGILLFGDIPIFVAHDSAEVWAHPEYFFLNNDGHPTVVAGVPPDYFSATGQRWGNPLYRWQRMEQDSFKWWLERMRSQLDLFDLVRIDHFRGFEAYWEIPAECPTAEEGRWIKAPGEHLFDAFKVNFSPLPIIAEDLGIITPEVDALRNLFKLPGMKILQFAFDGNANNPYLPHNHEINSVVYTGTHDNNTTVGWYQELNEGERHNVLEYLGRPSEPMPWPLIRAALSSSSQLAIIPVQDILQLDGNHRMNVPGVAEGNWSWRCKAGQLSDELANHCHYLVNLYGRL